MIAVRNRFHGHNKLDVVYRRGQTLRAPLVNLKYISNSNVRPYRAAVVVSKKVHKSAVVRNRIRRRIYEIVRVSIAAEHQAFNGYDLIFIVYSDQLAMNAATELQGTITDLLDRATRAPRSHDQAQSHGIVKSNS